MKILVVNDDSIYAPGIEMLARAATAFGEVYVVAPAEQCSALSQKLTLREQLRLERMPEFPVPVSGTWKLGGTPVDCVKVALENILPEKPDYVFSGINNGYNAGFDISYSGTLGAAFEAVRNGIPAAAFSIASDVHLPYAQPWLESVIRQVLEREQQAGSVWNVNFPAMKTVGMQGILWDRTVAPTSMFRETYLQDPQPDGSVLLTCQGRHTPDGEIPEGTDAKAVRQGYISIGPVRGVML